MCMVCGLELSGDRYTHVDHSHATGQVRGLLCKPCNNLIGFARDNIQTLKNAVEYLKGETKHEDQHVPDEGTEVV